MISTVTVEEMAWQAEAEDAGRVAAILQNDDERDRLDAARLRNQSAGDFAGAEQLYRQALALEGLRRFDESEPIYWSALDLFQRIFGAENLETAVILHNLANVRRGLNDPDGAESLYWLAAAMKEKLLGADHPDTAWTMHHYASMLAASGRTEEARDMERSVMLVLDISLAPSDPRRLAARQLLERLTA